MQNLNFPTKPLLLLSGLLVLIFSLFTVVCIASAAPADTLQPASTVTYNEPLVVNDTGSFDSLKVGKQGTGGVTFFNGTIINDTTNDGANNPVTFGDDLRIDGGIYRGTSKGTADDMPLKIYDSMVPGLDNANDMGTASLKWKDLYLAGSLTASSLQGTGIVNSTNIADGTIATGDIADSAVTNAKIANNAITTAKITDGTIATADIANNAITTAKITDGTITTADILNNAITSAKINDGTIVGGDVDSTTALTVGSLTSTGNIATSGTVDGVDVSDQVAVNYSTDSNSTTNLPVPSSNPAASKILVGTSVDAPLVVCMPADDWCYQEITIPSGYFTSATSYVVVASYETDPAQTLLTTTDADGPLVERVSANTFNVYYHGTHNGLLDNINWTAVGY